MLLSGPPSVPRDFRVSDVTSGVVVLAWSPGFNGGFPQDFIVDCKLSADPDSQYHPIGDKIPDVDDGPVSLSVTSLKPLSDYTFRIQAFSSRPKENKSQYVIVAASTPGKNIFPLFNVVAILQ